MAEELIAGYRLVARLPSGGMARVYVVEDLRLGRRVALKILHEHLAEDASFLQRFYREARIAAALNHPNIVTIYECGEDQGLNFIAMEFVPGRDLARILTEQGRLDPTLAARIGRQVAEALEYAHRAGVIHRDVKPENILVTDERRVVVTDFGIARAADGTRLTKTGTSMGTPEYMSPEQARGDTLDYRSDIYSLGVVLYEMVTGQVPFRADTPVATAMRHLTDEAVDPAALNPQVSSELRDIILTALTKDPDHRFQTAHEMAVALSGVAGEPTPDRPIHARPTRPLAPPTSRADWLVVRSDGSTLGPFSEVALRAMASEGGITWTDELVHTPTGTRRPAWQEPRVAAVLGDREKHVRTLLPGAPRDLPYEFASFWHRVGARLIDYLFLGGAILGMVELLGPSDGDAAAARSVLLIAAVFLFLQGWAGWTPGKLLVGLRVIDHRGQTPGFWRCLARAFGEFLNWILMPVIIGIFGYLAVSWHARKRGWHDSIAGTYVVRARSLAKLRRWQGPSREEPPPLRGLAAVINRGATLRRIGLSVACALALAIAALLLFRLLLGRLLADLTLAALDPIKFLPSYWHLRHISLPLMAGAIAWVFLTGFLVGKLVRVHAGAWGAAAGICYVLGAMLVGSPAGLDLAGLPFVATFLTAEPDQMLVNAILIGAAWRGGAVAAAAPRPLI